MRFRITDYLLPAVCYSIEIYKTPLSEQEFHNIVVEKAKYYGKRDGTSWLAVYSTTDSKDAERTVIRTGKRGRPRKIVHGTKKDGHVHLSFIGNAGRSAYRTAQDYKKSIDKKYKKPICKVVPKGNSDHAYNFIDYSLRQADIKRTGGEFDFDDCQRKHDFFS